MPVQIVFAIRKITHLIVNIVNEASITFAIAVQQYKKESYLKACVLALMPMSRPMHINNLKRSQIRAIVKAETVAF